MYQKRFNYKNRTITIKVSKNEYQELKDISEKLDVSISNLVRLGYLGRVNNRY